MDIEETDQLNPWLCMWTRPQQTIQQIIDTDPNRHVIWLAAMVGAVSSVLSAISRETPSGSDWQLALFLVSLMLGAVAGIGWIFLWGALIQWMGRGFNGNANQAQIRAVIAWSGLPLIAAGFLSILLASLTWIAYTIDTTIDPALLLTGFNAIHWGAAVYWALLFFRSLAQVQNFSVRKAVLNTALAALILHAFIALISIIVVALVDILVIARQLPM